MTVEDKAGTEFDGDIEYDQNARTKAAISTNGPNDSSFELFMLQYQSIRDPKAHAQLQNDLLGSDEPSSTT
ncbi:hypothetical protein PTTG_26372 [Puccinia triticina 1-1 BBBD Race 1]|uniref:Uncharacterized protein n=1 Tax=Puccinia triticina (isolate 1-1 / race 1 (BBBD)) TaxID=630390 RepID=A0A180GU98_PUCT1|nr:hypothetical protein PTTG_26372 [Puccinia triticina 1-1 BBBD Race 1]